LRPQPQSTPPASNAHRKSVRTCSNAMASLPIHTAISSSSAVDQNGHTLRRSSASPFLCSVSPFKKERVGPAYGKRRLPLLYFCCAKASVGNRAFSLRYACTRQKVSSLHARASQQPKGAFNLLFAATRSQLHATLHSHTSVFIITRSITPSQINVAFAGRGHHVRGSPMLAIVTRRPL